MQNSNAMTTAKEGEIPTLLENGFLSLRKLFLLLLFIVFLLIATHFFPENLSWTVHNRFNLDGEANLPTWFSTVLLFSVSVSSLIVHCLRNKIANYDHAWRFFWFFFAAVYCFLSIDEAALLHEIIDQSTSLKWIFLYAPFFGIFFFICSYYLLVIYKGDKKSRNSILGGLIIYVFGALVSESISYLLYPLPSWYQQVEFVLEEGFELVGTIIVLVGILQELNRLYTLQLLRIYKNESLKSGVKLLTSEVRFSEEIYLKNRFRVKGCKRKV
jgi:hypothetical protein